MAPLCLAREQMLESLLSGLLGAIIGALISTYYTHKFWLTQQRWAIREQYYAGLLTSLTKLKISLRARNEHFIEPGSEHDKRISEQDHFNKMTQEGSAALMHLQEQIGPASIFLSEVATKTLERLINDSWEVESHSISLKEFVGESLKHAEIALEAVQAQAKKELAP